MFKKLFSKQLTREKWDAELVWFRLRYLKPEGPTRCINLLSRSQACGRVALYYQPGESSSQLYLGIAEIHVRLLMRMVADFGYSLKPKSSDMTIPSLAKMTAVTNLPWDKPFLAFIVSESAFVSLVGGEDKIGDRRHRISSFLPKPHLGDSERALATWCLPDNPIPGLTQKPSWNGQEPPEYLIATEPTHGNWLLGRSHSGLPLQISGRINIYGRQEAVADWLLYQVTQMLMFDYHNLVVIDGVGDLVPRLKRRAAVTRLLGEHLAYIDIDGASLANGFNPLAAASGEDEPATLQRWQHWFQGMNVHPQGVQLLAQAQKDEVKDIPSLRKWLKQLERQGHYTATSTSSVQAVSSLGMALNRLTASRLSREWLEWPANRFKILPDGVLLFSCRGISWDRQQLLQAVLLGVKQVEGVRLILHGFSGKAIRQAHLTSFERVVISNGPLMPDSKVILTECRVKSAAALSRRFLPNNPYLQENLELLNRGEGIIISGDNVIFSTWHMRANAG